MSLRSSNVHEFPDFVKSFHARQNAMKPPGHARKHCGWFGDSEIFIIDSSYLCIIFIYFSILCTIDLYIIFMCFYVLHIKDIKSLLLFFFLIPTFKNVPVGRREQLR